MLVRVTILTLFLFCGCRVGLIDCPEAKSPKARQTLINTKNLKPGDLYSSSTSKDIHKERSLAELKEQKQNVKDPATIEEWDCPRPGENKNKKIVRENTRKMEKKRRQQLDSLHTDHSGMMIESH
jgi:hypothetical protein